MHLIHFILPLVLLFSGPLAGQSRWDGGGDGRRWQDSLNWSGDRLPGPAEVVFFDGLSARITGAPITVGGIRLESGARITLDVDATITIPPQSNEAISLGPECHLILGGNDENRVFTVQGSGSERGLACYAGSEAAHLTLAEGSDLYSRNLRTMLYQEDSLAIFINRGAIYMDSTIQDGLYARGTLENYGRIVAIRVNNDVISLGKAAKFTNDIKGEVTALEMGDDGIELTGTATFVNNGALFFTSSKDAASSNNCLNVGQEGGAATFLNNSDQALFNGGGGQESRPLFIHPKGLLINLGELTITGGSEGNSFFLEGTARIDTNAILELNQGRIAVAPSGRLTNDGLIRSDFARGGIHSEGFALNRGFYRYATDTLFATGSGENEDRGLALPTDPANPAAVLSAGGSCSVRLVSAPYRFYVGGSLIGQTEPNGELTFPTGSVDSLSVTLTTTLNGIEIVMIDLCPEAAELPTAVGRNPSTPLVIYPTLLTSGQQITIDVSDLPRQRLRLDIYDVSGRIHKITELMSEGIPVQLSSDGLPPGSYVIRLMVGPEWRVTRFQIR